MNRGAGRCPLTRQLCALLPGAVATARLATPWHSAGFAGERVTVVLSLGGEGAMVKAQAFAAKLAETEFTLPLQFVADILVSHIEASGAAVKLGIEALLLQE